MACAPTACPERLEVDHRLVDGVEGGARVLDAHRQRRPHRGDAVAQGAALDVGADGDRDHGPQDDALGRVAVLAHPAPGGERHGGQDGVVERPAEGVLDRLDVVEVGVDPRVAAVRADGHVERRRRRRLEADAGHRAQADRRDGELAGRAPRRAEHGADAAGDLGRHGDALHERVGQELGARRRRGRLPEADGRGHRGRVGARVEEDRGDVDARDAVDERVVGLRDHRPAGGAVRVGREALDDVHLPERLGAVELLGEEPPAEGRELLVAARGRQGAVAHVVADVEVGVVDPHRPPLPEGHEGQALAVAGDEVQPALDRGDRVVVGGRVALEHEDRGDVHVRAARLEVQEARIEAREAVAVAHDLILPPNGPMDNLQHVV